ncbi:MAG: HPP family protein [Phycisphaerae bacterium]
MKTRVLLRRALKHWRAGSRISIPEMIWFLILLGLMGGLDYLTQGKLPRHTIWLVPPFAATLSILILLPEAAIAQPIPVVAGSTLGAAVGTIAAMAVHGPMYAVLSAAVTLLVLSALRIYHPPGVALSMYPLLLHPGAYFSILVVFPFMLTAVCSAAVLSRYVKSWPSYPRPLEVVLPTLAQGRHT